MLHWTWIQRHVVTCVLLGYRRCIALAPHGAVEQRQLTFSAFTGSVICMSGQPPFFLQGMKMRRYSTGVCRWPANSQLCLHSSTHVCLFDCAAQAVQLRHEKCTRQIHCTEVQQKAQD